MSGKKTLSLPPELKSFIQDSWKKAKETAMLLDIGGSFYSLPVSSVTFTNPYDQRQQTIYLGVARITAEGQQQTVETETGTMDRIYLPVDIKDKDESEIKAIIAHEIAHVIDPNLEEGFYEPVLEWPGEQERYLKSPSEFEARMAEAVYRIRETVSQSPELSKSMLEYIRNGKIPEDILPPDIVSLYKSKPTLWRKLLYKLIWAITGE